MDRTNSSYVPLCGLCYRFLSLEVIYEKDLNKNIQEIWNNGFGENINVCIHIWKENKMDLIIFGVRND